jgi:hypothetical protein
MVIIDLDNGAPKASFRSTNGQYWSKGEEGKTSLAKRMSEKNKKRPKSDKMSKPNKKYRA